MECHALIRVLVPITTRSISFPPRPVFGVYAPCRVARTRFKCDRHRLDCRIDCQASRFPGFAVTRDSLSRFVRRFVERMAASGGGRTHLKIYLINGSIRSIKCTDRVEMQVRKGGPPSLFFSTLPSLATGSVFAFFSRFAR